MKKSSAVVRLVLSNILVTSVIGLTIMYLFIPLEFFAVLVIGIIFLAGQTALSERVYIRGTSKNRFEKGKSAEYVGC